MKRKYGSTKVPYEFLKGNLGIPADCNIDSVQNIQNRRLVEVFYSNDETENLTHRLTWPHEDGALIVTNDLELNPIIEHMRQCVKDFDEMQKKRERNHETPTSD
ncbi:hypothetical protein OCB09_00690 [Bacillus cereus]|uniref:hypothetical protein n=1 Tax=Bacillus cereus group TaxID=86661 RepID=UPI0018F28F50|nr:MULTISPECIES: hypothetical protein [Bacillus cereus group]MBJ7935594.1 hypothetical protein [Bacillus cereus]MCU5501883.1 hypothetical protein [Bacillus cereus]